jgi:hypothetical protein
MPERSFMWFGKHCSANEAALQPSGSCDSMPSTPVLLKLAPFRMLMETSNTKSAFIAIEPGIAQFLVCRCGRAADRALDVRSAEQAGT